MQILAEKFGSFSSTSPTLSPASLLTGHLTGRHHAPRDHGRFDQLLTILSSLTCIPASPIPGRLSDSVVNPTPLPLFFGIIGLPKFSLQTIESQRVTSNCFIRSDLHGAIVSCPVNLRNDRGGLGLSSRNVFRFVPTTGDWQLVYPPPPCHAQNIENKGQEKILLCKILNPLRLQAKYSRIRT